MKKIIALAAIMLLVATILVACNTVETEVSTTDIETETETEISEPDGLDITIFPEVEAIGENIQLYRDEVAARLEADNSSFIKDEEWLLINKLWDTSEVVSRSQYSLCAFNEVHKETSKYYYPVVFREGDALILWYTAEEGGVRLEELKRDNHLRSNYIGKAHRADDNEELMDCSYSNELTYSKVTGKVTIWNLGKAVETYQLPEESIYCGYSSFEGYIFRSGSDVYAFRWGTHKEGGVTCIAHNVKYVIDASYCYGSDPWSQPLFLMDDGSIKAYISWMGDNGAATDDPSHLCEIKHEGGYRQHN